MKGIKFVPSSLASKLGIFLLTFSVGAAAGAWLWLKKDSPVDLSKAALSPTFKEPSAQVNQSEILIAEDPVGPKIVQSMTVDFPVHGEVFVQAVQEVGKFPQLRFVGKNGEVLHLSTVEDKEKWLIPEKDSILTQPELRFQVIHSAGFKGPLIMSVAVAHGGSDDAFYLTVFGEVAGKIRRFNQKPIFANIQGGYYLGYLNDKFGYGLAVWNFVWENGAHYDLHNYEIELYRVQNGKLKRVLRKISKEGYDSDQGFRSLGELGIEAKDQRQDIPRINEFIDVDS